MVKQKVGIGYDIHRFVPGRKLVLGGVEIPYEQGLDGHSDADVLLHAVCDAILGALGKGDIGEHFPNTDPAYKDISSMVLLGKVKQLLDEENFQVVNLDCVVQAEAPKIKDFKPQMKFHLAYQLVVDEDCINIKATTQEGLGAIGQKQGIAAYAVVLIESNKVT
ncbi:MAG: 2-C-methyl-D-erythritol 2,4-cyclodiphosphate synthase [Candidatus Omnitrophica bacterium]|nr:2-C-methyl-D-erythritol 2,4-cyclodiphosphate synthase [Candidatus Omnitrophota bacterium]